MSWTLTTSGAAIIKAGPNVNADIITSGAFLAKWSDDSEGQIIAATRRDWVTDYASVPTGVKGILSDVCSSMIAKQIICYDMSGYTSRQEATTMLDVHDDLVQKGFSTLKDFKSNTIHSI